MSNTKVVDYLEQKGILNKLQADKVRVEMASSGKNEETILIETGFTDNEAIAQAKAEIFNIPYVNLKEVSIPDDVLSSISAESLKKFRSIPFEKSDNVIKLAMVDPFDIQSIQAIQVQFRMSAKIVTYITTQESINFVLDRLLGEAITTEVSKALEDVDTPVTDLDSGENDSLDDSSLKNAPVARVVNSILSFAVKSGASDIHVEPMETKLRVRFRINGVMTEKLSLPKNLISSVVSRIKILSNLKIDEKRAPQDGRFPVITSGHKVDIRVSTLPCIYGEKVVMRLLDSSGGVPALETSGLRGHAYKLYLDAIKATNGIILVTGPTGSGKTRTLAGTLNLLNNPKVNIITLENPVEIRIPGVNQVQINPEAGLTFASGLRAILRQDPNIVMVGEIRDKETAQLAVEASLTGHLVVSTLHTNSAAAAVPRLIDMGIEPYLLASTLRLVVAQRLPRRICPNCKVSYAATPEMITDIQSRLGSISNFNIVEYLKGLCAARSDPASQSTAMKNSMGTDIKCPDKDEFGQDRIYLYKGSGCDRCNGSGYSGRIGIFEVLELNEKMGRLMMDHRPESEIEAVAKEEGMILMTQDGYLKALEGITTIEEVLRVSKD